jgi:glucose-6-phosphate 1-dehydrogenase
MDFDSIRVNEPWLLVLMGITGDAAETMYAPGLAKAWQQKLVHPQTAIVGVAPEEWKGKKWTEADVKAHIRKGSGIKSEEEWTALGLENSIFFKPGDVTDSSSYPALKEFLQKLDEERQTEGRRLFILSLPPQLLKTVILNLAENGMLDDPDKNIVFVDKPWGPHLQGALDLRELVESELIPAVA